MSQRAKQAYEEWKRADDAARAREQELKAAWDEFFDRRASPPPDELIRAVSLQRAQANELLTITVSLMQPTQAARANASEQSKITASSLHEHAPRQSSAR